MSESESLSGSLSEIAVELATRESDCDCNPDSDADADFHARGRTAAPFGDRHSIGAQREFYPS